MSTQQTIINLAQVTLDKACFMLLDYFAPQTVILKHGCYNYFPSPDEETEVPEKGNDLPKSHGWYGVEESLKPNLQKPQAFCCSKECLIDYLVTSLSVTTSEEDT